MKKTEKVSMLRLTLIIVSLFIFASCGQKGAVTETRFVIGGFAAGQANPINGSLLLTAFNPTTQQILRLKMGESSQSLILPNGRWNFTIVYWDSQNTEAASSVRCGNTKTELTGGDETLDIILTQANCFNQHFNNPDFIDSSDWQPLELHQCDTIGDPNSNCATVGNAESVRIIFPSFQLNPLDTLSMIPRLDDVKSGCIASSGLSQINLSTKIPTGSFANPQPFIVQAFKDSNCQTPPVNFVFRRGLLSAATAATKVHDYTADTPDKTRIFIATSSSLYAVADPLLIPAENVYPLDLTSMISGGTPPYTFTKSASTSTLTQEGILTPGNTDQTFSVTATDALGSAVTFEVQTVRFATHTRFSNGAIGSWPTKRPSDGAFRMSSLGAFQLVNKDVGRFWHTPLDRYFLVEREETNYVLYSSQLVNASWTKNAATAVNFSDPNLTANVSILTKNSAASSFVEQNVIHPDVGTMVVSAFFKQGSSTNAVLTSTNNSVCRGVHYNFSTGTLSALTASGCATAPLTQGVMDIGNGWWRVWFSYPSGSIDSNVKIYPAWGISPSAEFSGGGANNDIGVFNVQLEEAQYPTSPINTNGAPVTRAAEYHQNTSQAGLITPNSGTLLLDYHPLGVSSEPFPLLSFCTGSSRILEISRIGTGVPKVSVYDNGAQVGFVDGITTEAPVHNRIVARLGNSELKMAMRGQSTISQGARSGSSVTPQRILMGQTCDGVTNQTLGVRRVGFWPAEFHDLVIQQMANGPL